MSEGNFVYYDEGKQAREAFRPDMAESIDSPAEMIAETFSIGITTAVSIYQGHLQIVERTEKTALARAPRQAGSYQLRPARNRRGRGVGIASAPGIRRVLKGRPY